MGMTNITIGQFLAQALKDKSAAWRVKAMQLGRHHYNYSDLAIAAEELDAIVTRCKISERTMTPFETILLDILIDAAGFSSRDEFSNAYLKHGFQTMPDSP